MTELDLDVETEIVEEVEAISSIYGEEFSVLDSESKSYSVQISSKQYDSNDSTGPVATFIFRYSPTGHSTHLLSYDLIAPWMTRGEFDQLTNQLKELHCRSDGEPVVYLMIETVRSFLSSLSFDLPITTEVSPAPENPSDTSACYTSVPSVRVHLAALPDLLPIAKNIKPIEVLHGDSLVDRKSIFQAHCAPVSNIGQISLFISTLLNDKKIAVATHNILAWRILTQSAVGSNVIMSDCDDDGETHAGARLLHLLDICAAENVVVMVSRWYGGIQLGPDRFKHINNVARNLLAENGFLKHYSRAGNQSGLDAKARKKKKGK